MEKIICLLDVDGVLNANKAGWSRAPNRSYLYADGISWLMRWEPRTMLALRRLHARPGVTILWATTWVGHTDLLEDKFGLPHFDSAASTSMSIADKQLAARTLAEAGNKIIWIDDEAIPTSGGLADFLEDNDALLIRPKSNRGLRPEHFDDIDSYVSKYN